MILISFFDPDPLDNIGDILFFQPSKCIFIGESSVIRKNEKKKILQFLKNRGMATAIDYHCIPSGDKDEALNRLTRLVEANPDCIFDVSGGTEMLISLAGYVAQLFDVPLYQRKGQSNELLWQMHCNLVPHKVSLTIDEVVALHSGKVLSATEAPEPGDRLYKDIPKLWEIARKTPDQYNSLCGAFAYLVAHSEGTDPLELKVSADVLSSSKGRLHMPMLREMEESGLIRDLQRPEEGLVLRFCSAGIRETLTKAGNLLEMVTVLAGAFAHDSAMGISMDWDGKLALYGNSGTRNELDVMLTVGLLPICISCKNGKIDNNALYELDTVSRHFAGNFAKRILVASYVNQNSTSADFLEQRARDMGIIPMFDVHKYSFEEFAQTLKGYCVPKN